MEIETVHDLVEHWRAQRGFSIAETAKEAQVSVNTYKKIRDGETVGREKAAAVEKALLLPAGAIEDFKKTGKIPEVPQPGSERQISTTSLKKGERLFETTTDYGVKYRLEIAEGYGASYTWPAPRPYYEIIPHLRRLSSIVATAGGLIEQD